MQYKKNEVPLIEIYELDMMSPQEKLKFFVDLAVI